MRLCCDIICFDNFVAYQRKQVSWHTNTRWILIKIGVRHKTTFLDRDLSVIWYQKRQKQNWSTDLQISLTGMFPHLIFLFGLKTRYMYKKKKPISHSIPLMTSLMCLYTAICNSFDKIRIFSLSYFPVLLGSCLAVINIWKYFIFISIWRRWSQLLFSPLLICLTDYETDEWPLAALFNFQIHLKAIFTSDKKISELI